MTLTLKQAKTALLALAFAAVTTTVAFGSVLPAQAVPSTDLKTCKDLLLFTDNLEGDSSGAWGSAEFEQDNGPLVLNVNDGYTVLLCVKKGSLHNGAGPTVLPPFTGPIVDQEVNYPGANPAEGFSHYAVDFASTQTANYCDPSQKPGGTSIGNWVPKDVNCVEPWVEVVCGEFHAGVTSIVQAPWGDNYSVVWSEGAPDYTKFTPPPAIFTEDYNGGSVDVYYWVVGPEKDYVTDRNIPNYWEQNAEKVTVDTDCKGNGGNGGQVDDDDDEQPTGGQVLGDDTEVPTSLPETGSPITAVVASFVALAGVVSALSASLRGAVVKFNK